MTPLPSTFDKGNNSTESFETVENSPFHFIGSLVPSQHSDLLQIPLGQFGALAGEQFEGCRAYRTAKVIFGQERRVVITYNDHLLEGQLQGINASLHKAGASSMNSKPSWGAADTVRSKAASGPPCRA